MPVQGLRPWPSRQIYLPEFPSFRPRRRYYILKGKLKEGGNKVSERRTSSARIERTICILSILGTCALRPKTDIGVHRSVLDVRSIALDMPATQASAAIMRSSQPQEKGASNG